MTDHEARLLLSACRPGGQDADDSEFATAQARMQENPALAAWFEQQRAADAVIAKALATIMPPADLRARILAGAAAQQPPARSAWRPFVALAALLIVFCGVLIMAQHPSSQPLNAWQHDSLAELNNVITGRDSLDHLNESPGELRHFLQASYAPIATPMPAELMNLRSLGCKVFNWREKRVSIICFHLTPKELVHLITIETPLDRGKNHPQFAERDGWNTATWVRDGKTYLLATKAAPEALHQILL